MNNQSQGNSNKQNISCVCITIKLIFLQKLENRLRLDFHSKFQITGLIYRKFGIFVIINTKKFIQIKFSCNNKKNQYLLLKFIKDFILMEKETTFLKIALNMLRLQIPKYININIKIFNKFVKNFV